MAQGNRGATGLAPARGPASNGGTRGVLQPKTNAVGGGREGGGPEDTEGDGEGPIVKAGETPVVRFGVSAVARVHGQQGSQGCGYG